MATKNKKIMIVEDDADMSFILENILASKGYDICKCDKTEDVFRTYSENNPDLLLTDRMLDGIDCISELEAIRNANSSIPIIMLTALTTEDELLEGFAKGATDYIKKPFSARELTARIAAHMRVSPSPALPTQSAYCIGVMRLERNEMSLNSNVARHKLTVLEYNLAKVLIENKNRTCSIEMLEKELWGDAEPTHDQCLRVYVSRLRDIFLEDKTVDLINIRSKGYILRELSDNSI